MTIAEERIEQPGLISFDEMREMFPMPWAETPPAKIAPDDEPRAGLNPTGFTALSFILLRQPGCINQRLATRYARRDEERKLYKEMLRGAEKFMQRLHAAIDVDGEDGPSPVPGLALNEIILLLAMFKMTLLYRLGQRDQWGEPIN